jgi:hypothetical protein
MAPQVTRCLLDDVFLTEILSMRDHGKCEVGLASRLSFCFNSKRHVLAAFRTCSSGWSSNRSTSAMSDGCPTTIRHMSARETTCKSSLANSSRDAPRRISAPFMIPSILNKTHSFHTRCRNEVYAPSTQSKWTDDSKRASSHAGRSSIIEAHTVQDLFVQAVMPDQSCGLLESVW